MKSVICNYCDTPAEWVENKAVYGKNYGKSYMIWLCPKCGAYVGCHNNTKTPKGTLANDSLRKARMAAHAVVDPLWQKEGHKRGHVYQNLSDLLGKPIHIGEADEAGCKEIISAVKELY